MMAFDARNRILGGGEAYVSLDGCFDGKIPPRMLAAFLDSSATPRDEPK